MLNFNDGVIRFLLTFKAAIVDMAIPFLPIKWYISLFKSHFPTV